MKVILGGGLVALLARDILGSGWTIIPYGKSRFYSFNPPLCDNYVIKDDVIDDYMNRFALIPSYIKNAFSLGGQLTYNHNIGLDPWLEKVYGGMRPSQADPYYRSHIDYFGYGDCLEIYRRLQQQYVNEILDNQDKLGKAVVKIHDHRIVTDTGVEKEYEHIISTIPLPALTTAMGRKYEFPCRDMWCYHIKTDWDMEGATHIRVADQHLEFYKVTKVNQVDYIFYSVNQIVRPGQYFMGILGKKFELIGEVNFQEAIPCGPIPDLLEVTMADITLMGSRAVWDDCLDIGSNIKRLVSMANLRK